jgi:hypothetical protein
MNSMSPSQKLKRCINKTDYYTKQILGSRRVRNNDHDLRDDGDGGTTTAS